MSQQKAFTLVELMVVLAVLAIFAMISAPGLQGILESSRVTSSTNTMLGMLQVARSEAITLRSRTRVCGTTDLQSCTGAPWSNRIMAFRDTNNNGQCDGCSAGAGELIRIANLDGSVSVTGSNVITFAGTGQLTSAVNLTVSNSSKSKSISISRIGQSRSY
ncbi:GspH/FimT family pseudopilin [Aquipseudomonas alcaligenes]|uniref:Type II secretion system protein H n=1 Tax=Aquipseudomonas alcaligenes (strain ATCC 14909 / DSM 50342 / CCUG 1425 / JCM 20561 / NBRC 14159 / NCIMB 9945 / NCTC 10367 / 1577) TaxID=1215092 RepID=U3BDM1_AQUA1|nr:GspH/FimT family pseudopilin [Pseudomonas alcaligenes]GAD64853.1 type 4 pilus biogenesis protein FimT [Pseudomonas alcaligenes NBRC 14159]SUD19058.1 prepilin-type N-terminal cleavage/methylation domain-containing protein [Pseudomonas alcaligenes]